MWRLYHCAILACALFAWPASGAPRAAADDLRARDHATAQVQSAFDPASVLAVESGSYQAIEVPDLSGFALKSAALVILIIASLVSVLLWRMGKPPLGRQADDDRALRVSDSLAIAPGVNVKALRTGSYQVLVGYDRHGIKGMLLLPDEFRDVLDAAETSLLPAADRVPLATTAYSSVSSDRAFGSAQHDGGATPRPSSNFSKRASVPLDVGWELNQRTT